MTDNRGIAFLDSGVGGLPYLRWARERLPGEDFIYLADNGDFPYGEKSAERLKQIVVQRAGLLIGNCNPKMIIIACNTASVVALASLRESYKIPFVGVVPAVKPAAERSKAGRIGLLATNGTVSDRYTDSLISEFAASCAVTRIGDGEIVNFIEHMYVDSTVSQRTKAILPAIEKMKRDKIDTLVIGCTHFIYIEDELRSALRDTVDIVDSVEGVGKQIIKLSDEIGRSDRENGSGLLFITHPSGSARYKRFAAMFDLEFSGVVGG